MELRKSTIREELELQLGSQLNALISEAHALNIRTAAAFDPTLQPAAFLVVRWLYSHGPSSATKIAESVAMDRSAISRLINQLKALGYVMSEPNPSDRRGVQLSLTEQGKSKTLEVLKEKESIFINRISELSELDLKSYIEMLQTLTGK
ncbi:MarR family transcriptional regulator [Niallia taxi]|uniref:MarR family winged helix-turn-helix transcriptional regulator n=1 Tax=Niallia taxi TaxID=2499688 RepID=UPI0021A70A43|nr:MarR family transcriptional regulator [Niallia taxi]MCT2346459.1 MarR family transcriptional regulator [Niallia taxi]WOD61338.1 MarR family transcriptional regulator [Niallia taxi]